MSVNIDKFHFEWCSLDSKSHIENTLGTPRPIPELLQEKLDEDGFDTNAITRDIPDYLKCLMGKDYTFFARNNTFNEQNDLSQFFIYTIFTPANNKDPFWCDDVVVFIQMGQPGDPRYVFYSPPQMFILEDRHLGDSGFFEWTLSWVGFPLRRGKVDYTLQMDQDLERINERFSSGYSNSPTSEIENVCYADPLWSEKYQGFLARVKDLPYPVVLSPYGPAF